mgnify:CR=1 FL=1
MNAHEKIAVQHKNVYVALAQAQAEMGPLVKGSVNPAFKSKYADLADLTSAVREPLTRNGLSFYHSMVLGDRDLMRTSLVHGESDTRIDCDVPLIVDRNNMQGMKSATTYAKRIGLESVTGIAPEDDDGNAAAKAAPVLDEKPARKGATTPAIIGGIDYINEADSLDDLKARWNNLPSAVKAEADVIAAKEAAKVRLTSQPAAPADLGGDAIPY